MSKTQDEEPGSAELVRRAGIALWRQIQSHLEREISDGTLKPGDKLPTEQDLARQFAVNRHTVRQAIGALEEAGQIRVEQGRGSFVREPVIDYRLSSRTRFSENIGKLRRSPGGRLLRAERVTLEDDIARDLALPTGSRAILIERLTEVDGRVIGRALHYFRPELTGLIDAYRRTGSITTSLQEIGVGDYRRLWTRIQARMPTAEDAMLLGLPRNRPVLLTESLNIDSAGRPLEYGYTKYSSDWVNLIVDHDYPGLAPDSIGSA